MDRHTLKLSFKGICSHFTGVVPGIPHRVVLPDASHVYMGLIAVGKAEPMAYCLLPHYVSLFSGNDPLIPLKVSQIAENGYVYNGVRMYVANAVPGQALNVDDWHMTPRIVDYVPDFRPSTEVVIGGRANAYFDIEGGIFKTRQAPGDGTDGAPGSFYTEVEIETDGIPVIAFLPFVRDQFGAQPHTQQVGNELTVQNADWDEHDEDAPFDFLLHYLCAERGIPQTLSEPTPGMYDSGVPKPLNATTIKTALAGLGEVIESGHPSLIPSVKAPNLHLTSSCSDTKYP